MSIITDVKPNIRDLLTIFVEPIQDLENAIEQVRLARLIDRVLTDFSGAVQTLLVDDLGRFVQQRRISADNTVYVRAIRARIRASRSLGQYDDLAAVTRLVVGEDATDVVIQIRRENIATVVIRVLGGYPDVIDYAAHLADLLRAAASGGVRVLLEYAASDDDDLLRADGLSPGVASFARAVVDIGDKTFTIAPRDPDAVGEAGNSYSLELRADGSGAAGSLTDGANAVFHFQNAVTTIVNFAAAIGASAFLRIIASTSGLATTLVTADADTFLLSGGVDGRLMGGAVDPS